MEHVLNFIRRANLPVILQTEIAECGLACLAMIINYFGRRIDMSELRRISPVTLKGMTLAQLTRIAEVHGLAARPVRLELSAMAELNVPCILHWGMTHFVVLRQVKRGGIDIHDPGTGRRFVAWKEVDRGFTGIAVEFTPTAEFRPIAVGRKFTARQLWSESQGFVRSITLMVLLSLALQFLTMLSPFYMQIAVDQVIVGRDRGLLILLAAAFGFVVLVQAAVSVIRGLLILYVSNSISFQVSTNLFRHLMKLPLSFFERRHVGDIVSRFGSLDQIRQQVTVGTVETVVDGVLMIGTLVMMLLYSKELSAIVLMALLIYMAIRAALFGPIRNLTDEQIAAIARRDSNFLESVRSMQAIKLFGREAQRRLMWQNMLVDSLNASIKQQRLGTYHQSANMMIFGLENVIVIYLGVVAILDREISIGVLLAFIAYKSDFARKSANVVDQIMKFRMLRLHLDRVSDVALTEPEKELAGAGVQSDLQSGCLELRNVTFRYESGQRPLIVQASFVIQAGESIAVVGPSGCGKTTLIKLMLGLLEPQEGEIQCGGVNIRKLGLAAYRQQVAAVMQDDNLISGSICDNITFFEEAVDTERMHRCARLASIHEDIEAMPMGYNTLVGDMGSSLSGGQRQRLLLARALYREPRILFMDEATSHLDLQTELRVLTAIKALKITRIFIAHRPETIRAADRVLEYVNGTFGQNGYAVPAQHGHVGQVAG